MLLSIYEEDRPINHQCYFSYTIHVFLRHIDTVLWRVIAAGWPCSSFALDFRYIYLGRHAGTMNK